MKNKNKLGFKAEKKQAMFLAVELPEWLREKLVSLQEELGKQTIPSIEGPSDGHRRRGVLKSNGRLLVTWELPEKLHITVLYLGKITQKEYEVIMDVLDDMAQGFDPIKLSVGYLDYQFQRHESGLVWVRVDSRGVLEKFHRELVRTLNKRGFSYSDKKLVPHVTLGRLKKMKRNDQKTALEVLTEEDVPDLGSFEVNEMVLMASRFRKDWKTTEYKEVERVKLT